ncbi:2S albumin seed storage protein [Melia azedarach]|uniref:2S albumin seed storage protein n=1 Tax=Melia azedarach TaxID=155640 RepID=A0ACC1YSW6_MELAZ|nr:2S albumin seed storage protein [Melia azedarach]
MAKLTLLLASFALFLLVANASIYRTTVEIDDENGREQSCQEQIQQQQQLRHCQMYMMQRVRGRQQESWLLDNQQQQQHLRQCCQELQQLDTRCRCQGLEQAARQGQQQVRGQEMQEELYETASNIPQRCNIQPRQGCQFSSPYSVSIE